MLIDISLKVGDVTMIILSTFSSSEIDSNYTIKSKII